MDNIKSLCFLLPSLKTGGGSRVMMEIANYCQKKKIETLIVVPNNSLALNSFDSRNGIKVELVGKYRRNLFIRVYNLLLCIIKIKKIKFDYIIFSDPFFSILSFLFPRHKRIRFIQADDFSLFDTHKEMRNFLFLRIYKFLISLSYSYKCNFLFNSQFTYRQFLIHSKLSETSLNLVYPAINPQIFNFRNLKDVNKINICLFGRPHPIKGFRIFLEAWNLLDLRYRSRVNDVYIISHDDLSMFNLHNFKKIRPNNDYEISTILNESQIFIFTSLNEGFGLPPLEAMACGCAVLVSQCGGVNEYAKHQYNCLMHKPNDIIQLKKNIELLLDDEILRHNISKNGVSTSKSFSWENSFDQFEKILLNL